MKETVIRWNDAPRFGQDGTEVVGYASPTRGLASLAAWRVIVHPGAQSPVHELTAGEAFLALAGEATFEFGDRRHEIRAGDGVCVPPDAPFRIVNGHAEPFEAVCCMAAGGMARIGEGEPFSPPWAC